MKNTIKALFVSITFITISFSSISQEIKWYSWNDAMAQQKKDLETFNNSTDPNKTPPKKVFMDIYTEWCGWCKKMDASTFKDPAIVNVMNQYYYPVKMDAEMKTPIDFNGHTFVNPDPEGKRSTHQFAASILDYGLSYPSYVMLDENTNRLVIYRGYKQVDDLLGILLFFGKNQHIAYQQGLEKQYEQKANAPQSK
jgi:thioredoxin-related protein